MTISVGEKLPQASFKIMTDDGPQAMSTAEVFDGKKVVIFGVPGAFTPTCHANHLPGFVNHHDEIKAKGVDVIAVTSVNDHWVMNEWAKASGATGKILFLSDGAAEFAKAIGMDIDLSAANMGIRSKRYSMIVEDGTVTRFNIEEAPGTAELSGAAAILDQL